MKRSLLPAIPLLLAVSCQVPVVENFDGEEAQAAYDQWRGQLVLEETYPAQLHLDYDIEMDMDIGTGEAFFMAMDLACELAALDAESLSSWGTLGIDFDIEGEQDQMVFDYQLTLDERGMRLTFDDGGFFEANFGSAPPTAFTLSADRLEQFLGVYSDLITSSYGAMPPEALEVWQDLSGPGQLLHPISMTRFLTSTDLIRVHGWDRAGSVVHLVAKLDDAFVDSMNDQMAMLGMDLGFLNDMEILAAVDYDSGIMLDYAFDMAMPLSVPTPEAPNGSVEMDMKLAMGIQSVMLDPSYPTLEDGPDFQPMDLDPYFDAYFPLIQMAMEMQAAQVSGGAGDNAADDFDF